MQMAGDGVWKIDNEISWARISTLNAILMSQILNW